MSALERAIAEAERGDWIAALAAALDAWRLAPCDALVGVIDQLSTHIALPPVTKRKPWRIVAGKRRPEDVPSLVDGLVGSDWASSEDLDRLAALDADPRIAAAGPRLSARLPRDRPRLAALLAPHRPAAVELASDVAALVERLVAIVRMPEGVESRLRAAVFADPDADGPRSVYADFLLGRDDPRGELIALQLSQPGSERAQELEKLLFGRCLGALAGAIAKGTLERGFVVRARLARDLQRVSASIGAPDWATVRVLEVGNLQRELVVRLLAHPVMARLEELHAIDVDVLAACRTPMPGVHTVELGDDPPQQLLESLVRGDAFPALTALRAHARAIAWLPGSPLAARLRRVVVTGAGNVLAWLGNLAGFPHDCVVELAWHASRIVVADRLLHATQLGALELAGILDALPANTFREIHIAGPLTDAALGYAATRHGGLRVGQPPPTP